VAEGADIGPLGTADPDCVNKAKAGKGDEIRPCIRCCICTGDDPHGCPKPLRCTVNPVSGRNLQFDVIPKAEAQKKVVVVGGGAAGMEAARRLAQRGHRVVLFEKDDRLGGTLIQAGANELKGDVRRYMEWSVRMTHRTPGVDIRTGTEATRERIFAEKPDAVIIAVGSEPIAPNIPGIDGENVFLAVQADTGEIKPGHKVLIVGAGLTGTETAVALAKSGHDVTVIDMLSLEEIDSRGTSSKSVTAVLRGMAESSGVKTLTGLALKSVLDGKVIAEEKDGTEKTIDCDTVLLSVGVRPRTALAAELDGCAVNTYVIGDCANKAGNITSAVREGFYAAMNIE